MVAENKIGWIDLKTYNKIIDLVPITCVDLLIVHKNKFLLGKRVNQPGRNEWYYPGGRVHKGESLKNSVIRKAKEELGLSVSESQIFFLTTKETIFKGKTLDENRHTINSIFKIELENVPDLSPDKKQISVLQWFTQINEGWNDYTKETLRLAGF